MAVMARGPQTLRLTLTTAMVEPTLPDTALAVVDTDSDWLAAMAMVVLATVMARGLPTLRLMPTTAMAVMVGTDLDTPLATAMVDTATSDKSAKGCRRELQPMKYAASQN